MKKSKKLLQLKRNSFCGQCRYSAFNDDDYFDYCYMTCSRHSGKSILSIDCACSHFVPFGRGFCPRKPPYYWDDENYIPF